jgi:hypothetical protein
MSKATTLLDRPRVERAPEPTVAVDLTAARDRDLVRRIAGAI